MRRLSTLVYAPVLFTLLTACGPKRAARVAAHAGAPQPSPASAKPASVEAASTTARAPAVSDEVLAAQLEEAKHKLTYGYFVPFRPDPTDALPPLWDPMDVKAPMRKEIEAHLKMMLGLYQQRMAIDPRPQLILDYHHTSFILREFEAADARELGK